MTATEQLMRRDGNRRRGHRARDRGQTLHDYVAGISVFILTVTVVIGFLPSVLAPYQANGNVADATTVERISDRLVSNLSTASAPNVLDSDQLSSVLAKDNGELQRRYGLAEYQNVNISVVTMNGSAVVRNQSGDALTAGANNAGNPTTAAARVISLSERPDRCTPACRLVVEVW